MDGKVARGQMGSSADGRGGAVVMVVSPMPHTMVTFSSMIAEIAESAPG